MSQFLLQKGYAPGSCNTPWAGRYNLPVVGSSLWAELQLEGAGDYWRFICFPQGWMTCCWMEKPLERISITEKDHCEEGLALSRKGGQVRDGQGSLVLHCRVGQRCYTACSYGHLQWGNAGEGTPLPSFLSVRDVPDLIPRGNWNTARNPLAGSCSRIPLLSCGEDAKCPGFLIGHTEWHDSTLYLWIFMLTVLSIWVFCFRVRSTLDLLLRKYCTHTQSWVKKMFSRRLVFSLSTMFSVRLDSSCLKLQGRSMSSFYVNSKHFPWAGLPDPALPVSAKEKFTETRHYIWNDISLCKKFLLLLTTNNSKENLVTQQVRLSKKQLWVVTLSSFLPVMIREQRANMQTGGRVMMPEKCLHRQSLTWLP